MIPECPKCGDPLVSDAPRCPRCGTELHPQSAVQKSRAGDAGLARSLLILGLFSALQGVRIFTSPGVAPWVQLARGVLGVIGVVFLLTYHRADVSSLAARTKLGLRFGVGLDLLLLMAVWL